MDDAVRAREAAREALADIEPDRLRDVLWNRLADASMAPGVLTVRSARGPDSDVAVDGVLERAAGVQLIYEGLRLTRSLAHDEPWDVLDADGPEEDTRADLDVLAADVLVSRGFYLLARTEAADRAVSVVRSFGRDQTVRRATDTDADALDRNLEADVFALAVVAGVTAVGREPTPDLVAYAGGLAAEVDGELPPTTVSLAGVTPEELDALSGGSDERVRPSATDP